MRRLLNQPWVPAAVLVLAVIGPVVQELTAQPGPRYALSAALYEGQTVVLDDYAAGVFVDRLEHDGHLYSDKAPAQPFLAVPAYALGRVLGAESATHVRLVGNLGLWGVTLFSSVLPAVVLVALMFHVAREVSPRGAVLASLSLALGTLLLPFGAQLYAHVLTAALCLGGWLALRREPLDRRWALAGGALLGLAVATEYPAAIVLVVLLVDVGLRSWRRLLDVALGGLPFAGFLLLYQWAVLGNPFETSYDAKDHKVSQTPLITGVPKPGQAVEILFGSRGLLLFTPLVGVAVVGLIRLARRRGLPRRDLVVVGAVALGFFALQAGWDNPWGGLEMPGPRYLIPAIPFLAAGAAAAWDAWPRITAAATLVSVLSMVFPLIAIHLVASDGTLVAYQLDDLSARGPQPTLFTMAIGDLGWVLHGALVVAAALWVARRLPRAAT